MDARWRVLHKMTWLLGLGALGLVTHAGCDDEQTGGSGGTSAGTTAGGGGSGGSGMGGGGMGGGCSVETLAAEPIVRDLFFLLDHTSSMVQDGSPTPWDAMVQAIGDALPAVPELAGTGLGLQVFPVPWPTDPALPDPCASDGDCGLYGPCDPTGHTCAGAPWEESCDPSDYGTPAAGIQALPDGATAFSQAVTDIETNLAGGGDTTPLQPALEGAVSYVTGWAADHPGHAVSIVVASDDPLFNCSSNDIAGVQAAAADAASADPPVTTYALGFGEGVGHLDQLAQAGGTLHASPFPASPNPSAITTLLVEIRDLYQCAYRLPEPQQSTFDSRHVNVVLTSAGTPSSETTVLGVADADACNETEGGWYYDAPLAPTMIWLCPASCAHVLDDDASVSMQTGCPTVTH